MKKVKTTCGNCKHIKCYKDLGFVCSFTPSKELKKRLPAYLFNGGSGGFLAPLEARYHLEQGYTGYTNCPVWERKRI